VGLQQDARFRKLNAPAPSLKGLPRPLAKRSAIDPFIVMDVMGEANAREKAGAIGAAKRVR
jgi:hypothetical protein